MPGVRKATVSFDAKEAEVSFDAKRVKIAKLIEALEGLGYESSVKVAPKS